MTPAIRKLLIILLVAVNALIWPFWIIPGLMMLMKGPAAQTKTSPAINRNRSGRSPDSVIPDFRKLRDPFRPAISPADRPRTPQKNSTSTGRPASSATASEVKGKFVSQFRLRSVVQFKGQYVATLEEIPHYGSSPSPNTYRFGTTPPEDVKTFMVKEGDIVLGETVTRIRENSVVMTKDSQNVQLIFSGDQ